MYRNEFRKVIRFIPMWGYLIFCLFLNLILTFNADGASDLNSMSEALTITGTRPSIESVAELPEGEIRDELQAIASSDESLYDSYDVSSELASGYIRKVSGSPMAVAMLESKYDKVQERVDHLADIEADRDAYAGSYTTICYKELFTSFLPALTAEASILAMLLTVYLFSYESNTNTYYLIACTKKGRKVNTCKLITALVSSLLFYAILTVLSLLIYFGHWNYDGIWDSNISSMYNIISDAIVRKPFITVTDLTVRQYITATLALGTVLITVAVLFASVIGLLVKKTYVAGLLTLIIPAFGVFLSTIFSNAGLWGAYLLTSMLPVNIWTSQHVWFTEGGICAPCMWYEVKGLGCALILFTILTITTLRYSRRRDIA